MNIIKYIETFIFNNEKDFTETFIGDPKIYEVVDVYFNSKQMKIYSMTEFHEQFHETIQIKEFLRWNLLPENIRNSFKK